MTLLEILLSFSHVHPSVRYGSFRCTTLVCLTQVVWRETRDYVSFQLQNHKWHIPYVTSSWSDKILHWTPFRSNECKLIHHPSVLSSYITHHDSRSVTWLRAIEETHLESQIMRVIGYFVRENCRSKISISFVVSTNRFQFVDHSTSQF